MLSIKTTRNTVNLKPLLNIDLSPVLNDGIDIIGLDIQSNYDNSVDYQKKPLAPLKPTTIEQKKKRGYPEPEKPLKATGKLSRNQKKQRATKASQRAVIYISQSGRFYHGVPADKIYGYHDAGSGKLPQRQPWGISDQARKKIATVFHARIKRIVLNLGR